MTVSTDYAFSQPNWLSTSEGAGNCVGLRYDQAYTRVNWTLNSSGVTGAASSIPTFNSSTGSLGYLSAGSRSLGIPCEFVGRRTGAIGDEGVSMWAIYHDDEFQHTDLSIRVTFRASTGGSRGGLIGPIDNPAITGSGVGFGGDALVLGSGGSTATGSVTFGSTKASPGTLDGGLGNIRPPVPEMLIGFRLGGTHVTSATAANYDTNVWERADGYWLRIQQTPASSTTGQLVATLYSTQDPTGSGNSVTIRGLARQTIFNGAELVNTKAPMRVRIESDDVGGNPTFECFLSQFNGSEVRLFDTSVVASTVITDSNVSITSGVITDANVLKQITAAGTVAFGGSVDRKMTVLTPNGESIVSRRFGASKVEIRKISSGALLYEDEFERVGVGGVPGDAATYRVKNQFGSQGSALEPLWNYGMGANADHTSGDIEPLLKVTEVGSTADDPAAFGTLVTETASPATLGPLHREYAFLRRSDQRTAHHRSVEFKVGTQSPGTAGYAGVTFHIGLCLRASASGGTIQNGIIGYLEITTASGTGNQSSITAKIGYYQQTDVANSAPTITVVASQAVPGSPNMIDGAFHTLDFDCYSSVSAADSLDAPALYKLKLDGTAIAWTTDDVTEGQGVSPGGSDQLIDQSPSAKSGYTEAVAFYASVGETNASGTLWNPWQIRNFDQQTLSVPGGSVSVDDQASIVIAGKEGTPTGELSSVLSGAFEYSQERYRPVQPHHFESGHTQAAAMTNTFKERFSFQVHALDPTQVAALRTFWDDHNGSEIPFNWTYDAELAAIKCRFVEDSLLIEQVAIDTFYSEFQVETLNYTN